MSPARLYHELTGPVGAPVLVLGNSLGTGVELWDPQLAVLRRHFRVLRFDLRGHRGSAVPAGPYTLDDLGGDLLGLLDELHLARVSYGGVSLGAMIGMWLAVHAPRRVRRLALCCTSAYLGPPEPWLERAATVRAKGVAAVAETVAGRWFTPGFRGRAPGTVGRFTTALSGTPAEGYAGCCEAVAMMDLRPSLPMIDAPTLVLSGADDPATPPEHGAAIATTVGGRFAVVPGAHLANVESAEEVGALLLSHFTG
ncbi:MAG: 3-oxoadipate enol-lactonase [Actinobacteria bacterium 13_2_20CM_2_71_6]|nr:MAG: 3-oxoadipate enol-lactonase [Actinobacteria bacterium 13_2_20CM_2_71_6]